MRLHNMWQQDSNTKSPLSPHFMLHPRQQHVPHNVHLSVSTTTNRGCCDKLASRSISGSSMSRTASSSTARRVSSHACATSARREAREWRWGARVFDAWHSHLGKQVPIKEAEVRAGQRAGQQSNLRCESASSPSCTSTCKGKHKSSASRPTRQAAAEVGVSQEVHKAAPNARLAFLLDLQPSNTGEGASRTTAGHNHGN